MLPRAVGEFGPCIVQVKRKFEGYAARDLFCDMIDEHDGRLSRLGIRELD